MGLILDSSVLITAERNHESVENFLKRMFSTFGNQQTSIASVALVEIVHGIYRAKTQEMREQRHLFVRELLADLPVYPLTRQMAFRAGQIDGEQQAKGVKIPFQDLLIGATALELQYSVVTHNVRHFQMIPNLEVKQVSAHSDR